MGRLLVVDDEPMLGRTLARVLSDWDLTHVADVASAKAQLAASSFDAVLCDWQIGTESGLEVWEHVDRDNAPLRKRFAFMTGSSPVDHPDVESLGPPVLRKPFSSQELRSTLAQLLAR